MKGALWSRLAAALDARGAAPALTFLDSELAAKTYSGRELRSAVELLARRFDALPHGDGPVGILASSQEAQVLHFLAALSRSRHPALLTPHNRKLKLEHYAQTLSSVTAQCGFSAVVTDVPGLELPVPLYGTYELEPRNTAQPPLVEAPPEGSFVQFSSGTTGIKRGVTIRDEAVVAQIDTYAAALALKETDVVVSWLPLYHDMGFIACFLMPLAHGVSTVLLDPLDWVARPATYLKAVSRFGGTLSWHPNFAYAFMAERVNDADLAGVSLASLRALVNCSEPATFESQRRFAKRFEPLGLRPDVFCGCYAMAETTFALTHGVATDPGYLDRTGPTRGAPPASPALSAGRPLPGVVLEVVSENGTLLGEREVGELRVRSPFDFTGYYRNPDATVAVLGRSGYLTGDLGYRASDEVFVCGRKKDVLIVGGVNIWPQDVEDIVCGVEGVRAGRAAAFSVFDDQRQTEQIVVLAETDAAPEQHRAIALAIRQRIASALQLANFEVHVLPPGWLVKSSSGKMARAQNRARWLAGDRP